MPSEVTVLVSLLPLLTTIVVVGGVVAREAIRAVCDVVCRWIDRQGRGGSQRRR